VIMGASRQLDSLFVHDRMNDTPGILHTYRYIGFIKSVNGGIKTP
jgi:hypothetical protein